MQNNKPEALPIHDLATIVPMANKLEQDALNIDIAENGFKMELGKILLYQGKIVDGRCRQKALLSAGLDPREYAEEIDKKDDDEVISIVKAANTRRNLTTTQKAISAYNTWKNGLTTNTQDKVAESWGIGVRSLKNVSSINKSIQVLDKSPHSNTIYSLEKCTGALAKKIKVTDILEKLLEGDSIKIDENKPTDALKTIAQNLKYIAEDLARTFLPIENYEWKADAAIKSERGKDTYYSIVNNNQMSVDTQISIVKLVNTIYPSTDEQAMPIPLALVSEVQKQIDFYKDTKSI